MNAVREGFSDWSREGAGAAVIRLGGHEGLHVAGDQRLHHRMLRREGLQQDMAAMFLTAVRIAATNPRRSKSRRSRSQS